MPFLIQLLLNGIIIGAVYGLFSLGYAFLFSLNINNFSYGSMVMLGSFASYIIFTDLHMPAVVVFFVVIVFGAGVGWLLYWLAIKPFNKPENQLTIVAATLGVSIITDNIIFLIHGDTFFSIRPFFKQPEMYHAGSVIISSNQVILIGSSVALMAIVLLTMRKSAFGLQFSALADDAEAMVSLGYNTGRIILLTTMLSTVLAFIGGYLISLDYDLGPGSGWGILTKAYAATIIGGQKDIKRVLFAAYFIGVVENLVSGYISSQYMLATVFTILIVFLIFKKQGFSRPNSVREY